MARTWGRGPESLVAPGGPQVEHDAHEGAYGYEEDEKIDRQP